MILYLALSSYSLLLRTLHPAFAKHILSRIAPKFSCDASRGSGPVSRRCSALEGRQSPTFRPTIRPSILVIRLPGSAGYCKTVR
ncbi:hypothetical protein V8C26DRAFT_25575 [Trichoderma gracile]